MSQPYTLSFGPWLPDLNNVGVQLQFQYSATVVPSADVNNIYYADGAYKSLPTPIVNGGDLPSKVMGAITAINPDGSVSIYAGTDNEIFSFNDGLWYGVSDATYASAAWRFVQTNDILYAVDAPSGAVQPGQDMPLQLPLGVGAAHPYVNLGCVGAVTGSVSGTVLTVSALTGSTYTPPISVGMPVWPGNANFTGPPDRAPAYIFSFGTGTGGTGTYNLSNSAASLTAATTFNIGNAPAAQVIGTSTQFILLGDILWAVTIANGGYQIGTGNGSTLDFNGTVGLPFRPGSVYVGIGTTSKMGPDVPASNGFGTFTGPNGTFNVTYATGQVSAVFTTAPPNTDAVVIGYTVEWANRLYWSGVDAPALWPFPNTNAAEAVQSSYQDLPQEAGPIMFISGYPSYFVVFQRLGITRAQYVGGAPVWSFQQYEFKKGLITPSAAVQVDALTFFLSDEGFFVTDGAQVMPIGTTQDNSAGIDNWFKSNVNYAALTAITAAWDASLRCVVFAIPTGSNTAPDTLLIFNPRAQRWTRSTAAPCTLIWTDTDGTKHRLGLIDQTNKYNLLTGTPAAGYCETCDIAFTDGMTRYTTGVRPQVNCTDSPLTTIGNRNTLSASVTYSAATAMDAFSGIAPFLASGIYTRLRVGSSAAQAIHGGTLMLEQGGPM